MADSDDFDSLYGDYEEPDDTTIPTTGNWYPPVILGSAPGDEECANNPQRKVYGVSPCFGRVMKIEPPSSPITTVTPEEIRNMLHRQGVHSDLNDEPILEGPAEDGFTNIMVTYWGPLVWNYIYISVDLSQTTDLFLRWYIYWATNYKADEQILQLKRAGEIPPKFITSNGTLLSLIASEYYYGLIHMYDPYPEKISKLYVERHPDPLICLPVTYYDKIQVKNLTNYLRNMLNLPSQSFFFQMAPGADKDIPREHHFLDEVVDKIPGILYWYPRYSDEEVAQYRRDHNALLSQPHRTWGFDQPIHVRTPVTIRIPQMCDHTFEWNLQMAVKTVEQLRNMITDYFPNLKRAERSLRFSRYSDPTDMGEPTFRANRQTMLTLDKAAYPDGPINANSLSRPITIYTFLDLVPEGTYRRVRIQVTYHQSLAQNDTQQFTIEDCPFSLFIEGDNPDVWLPPVRRLRELCNRKLFETLGITPDIPRLTEFTYFNGFPESSACIPVSEASIQDMQNSPLSTLSIHMWNSSPDMLFTLDRFLRHMRRPQIMANPLQGMFIDRRYEIDRSLLSGHPDPPTFEQLTRRNAQREILREPLVYYEPGQQGVHQRGGGLSNDYLKNFGDDDIDDIWETDLDIDVSDDELSPSPESGDHDTEGFDLSDEEFEAWLASRHYLDSSDSVDEFSISDDDLSAPGSGIIVRWTVLDRICSYIVRTKDFSAACTVGGLKEFLWVASRVHPEEQVLSFPDHRVLRPNTSTIDLEDGRDWLNITLQWNENSIAKEDVPVAIHFEDHQFEFIVPNIPTTLTRLEWFIEYGVLNHKPYVDKHGNDIMILISNIERYGYELKPAIPGDESPVLMDRVEAMGFMRAAINQQHAILPIDQANKGHPTIHIYPRNVEPERKRKRPLNPDHDSRKRKRPNEALPPPKTKKPASDAPPPLPLLKSSNLTAQDDLSAREDMLTDLETAKRPAAIYLKSQIQKHTSKLKKLLVNRSHHNSSITIPDEMELISLELDIIEYRSKLEVPSLRGLEEELGTKKYKFKKILETRSAGGAEYSKEIQALRKVIEGLIEELEELLEEDRREYERLATEAEEIRRLRRIDAASSAV